MLSRWQGGFATVVVMLVAIGLVAGDLADGGFRGWWEARPLTTDMASGLLTLLVTVLIVDQVLGRRRIMDRARATAAQAAIVLGQAARSAHAMGASLDGTGEREAATDEVRTYMIMLLVAAPVLIEAKVSRDFLEAAQLFGGQMTHALTTTSGTPGMSRASLDAATKRLKTVAAPLIQQLNLDELIAAGADQPG